jgi:hypothetical protein
VKIILQLDDSELALLEQHREPQVYGDCVSVAEFLEACAKHKLVIEGSFVGQAVQSRATGPLSDRFLTVVGSLTELKFK